MPMEALKELGLDYDTLAKIKPDIIATNVSTFGSIGQYRNRIGFDGLAQAMSGAMHLTGDGVTPMRMGMPWVDFGTVVLRDHRNACRDHGEENIRQGPEGRSGAVAYGVDRGIGLSGRAGAHCTQSSRHRQQIADVRAERLLQAERRLAGGRRGRQSNVQALVQADRRTGVARRSRASRPTSCAATTARCCPRRCSAGVPAARWRRP